MTDWREKILGAKGRRIWNGDTDYLLSDGLASIALSSGMSCTDIRIIIKDYGVLLVVRFGRTSEGAKIAFYGGQTVGIAAEKAAVDLSGEQAKVKIDQWAIDRLDKD